MHKTTHIEQNTSIIETINLRHMENRQIDTSILWHAITILLKTTLPETLLHALSLYQVNHQYDPKDVSAPLSSAAQLIHLNPFPEISGTAISSGSNYDR